MSGSIAQYISSTMDNYAENSSVEFLLNSKNLNSSKKKRILIAVATIVTIILLFVIIFCSLSISSSEEPQIIFSNSNATQLIDELKSMDFTSNSTFGR